MRNVFFTLMSVVCLGACVSLPEEKSDLKLWFSTPADATVADSPNGWDDDKEWVKALPLGNGSLGAMVFGDVNQERIQLNEETMWSGSQQACDNPDAAQHLDRIKELLFAGKFKEATELTNRTQICEGFGSGHGNGSTVPFGCYQTLGDLWIDFGNKGKFSDYRRELDLVNAIARVTYKQDGATYQREIFVSQPDQVLVMKLTTDNPNGLSFTCRINRPECYQTHTEEDQLVMSGSLNDGKRRKRFAVYG
jgi:alpha-L-fucosidase 2